MVSRVVGTGLIIVGGDYVSGLEGSYRGLRVGLSCGVGPGHLEAALAWVVVLGLGPGVSVLPCAPGGEPCLCLGGLGCLGHATVGVG